MGSDRQTDRQIHWHSLTPFTGVFGFFLSVKFANSLVALLAGGQTLRCVKERGRERERESMIGFKVKAD